MTLVTSLLSALFSPFQYVPERPGIIFLALVTGVVTHFIFDRVGNQAKIGAVKKQIGSCLLEMRVFGHDLRLILRAQWRLFAGLLRYVGLYILPTVAAVLPILLILPHVDALYGHTPLSPGDAAILSVTIEGAPERGVTLQAEGTAGSEAFEIETPALHIPSEGKVEWRVRAKRGGQAALQVTLPGSGAHRCGRLLVGAAEARMSPWTLPDGAAEHFLHPGEPPLPKDSPIHSTHIKYPVNTISLFGYAVHWLVAYCVLAIIFAMALKVGLRR